MMNRRRRGPGLNGLLRIAEQLSDRDRAVLRSVQLHRFMTSGQLQRLHFDAHASPVTAARSCRRVLARLQDWQLLDRLQRRIGGFGAGSAASIWHLTLIGQRLLSLLSGEGSTPRVREPSPHFVEHALAVAEVRVRLAVAARLGQFSLSELAVEPACWRSYPAGHGGQQTLKPDLYVVTSRDDFDDCWFVEVDLATEHLPTVLRKAHQYEDYRQSGLEQAQAGVFPLVAWATSTTVRRDKLHTAFQQARQLDHALHRTTTIGDLDRLMTEGTAP